MSTYYLISSLPMLSLDSQPLITAEAFLVACQAQLSADDADAAKHSFATPLRNILLSLRGATKTPSCEMLSPALAPV